MIRAALFILVVALLGGCGDHLVINPICEEEIAVSHAYIVDGVPSTDRRATVKVLLANNRYCSGTVVGPHVVLTAAHCREPYLVTDGSDEFVVAYTLTHELYAFPQADLQVVYVSTVLPLPYAGIATGDVLANCTGVLAQGWGRGGDGALHERRIFAIHHGRGLIWTTEGPCFGDSGSGLYVLGTDELEIIGTLSMGTSDDCYDGVSGFVDLLTHGDWVTERIQ